MKRGLFALIFLVAWPAFSQTLSHPARMHLTTAQMQERVEAYLRKIYAWGPTFRLKMGTPSEAPVMGLLRVPVEVTYNQQSDNAVVYVSLDGRFLFRGQIDDMLVDPFAGARRHLHLQGNPSIGPADARVTVVEFSDFECPHCRELYETLKTVEPRYPQVRFVFQDFPLVQIHPWAMTAALAARCAYLQNPAAFWKVQSAIFDNQEIIKPENAWEEMVEFAREAGLDPDAFRACMASPQAKQAVEANIADGNALRITSTPTVFVNGRLLVGGNRQLLEQYIDYELAAPKP